MLRQPWAVDDDRSRVESGIRLVSSDSESFGGGVIPRCLGDQVESNDSASLPECATGKVV